MEDNIQSAQILNLSLSDLEYALDLLSREENTEQDSEVFIASLIGFLSLGVFFLSCILGLMTLWVDNTLGWILIATAITAAIVFTIYVAYSNKTVDVIEDTKTLFEQLQKRNLGDVTKQGWEKQSQKSNLFVGCLVITFIPLCIWGFGWLILGVIQKEINTTPIYLISIPFISIWGFIGINIYREYSFYNKVLGLANKFQKAKQNTVKQDLDSINISSEEADLLSQIEAKKVQHSIAQVELNIQKLFAITINQNVVNFLKKLKERSQDDYYNIRDTIDALQEEPRPKTSIALREQPASYQTRASNYQIDYIIDNERQRIEITQISKSESQEILYGS